MAVTPGMPDRLAERRRALLAALGDPQRELRIVHVAGTNGKGSTVAIVAAVLRASGLRVGRFTSPDLNGPHERFWVDGETIDPEVLAGAIAALAPIAEAVARDFPDLPEWRPFELWCAAAWGWFRQSGVDVAVVEVGMGGRTDATNVFDRPEVTLVTAIGLDHTLCLSDDVSLLAAEKAGIFRSGVPAMTTATAEALGVLEAEAARVGAPFHAVAPLEGRATAEGGFIVTVGGTPAHLALSGLHQLENAALALAGIAAMRERGWVISDAALAAGLADVTWPGRMERLPDALGGAWLLDAAHNPNAVSALISSWDSPAVAVVGVQRSKEAAAMVAALSHGGLPLVLVPVPDAACWSPDELAAFASGPTYQAADVEQAIAIARRIAPHGLRAITGSIYMVGAARARLLRSG